MLVNCKNGVSSCEIHRDLGITQKIGWCVLQRPRFDLEDVSPAKLSGGPVQLFPFKPAIAPKLQRSAILCDGSNDIVGYASGNVCIDIECDLHV